MRIIVGAFFGLVLIGGAIGNLLVPAEILVLDDGTIVFNGAVGSTRLRARDIQYLEGKLGRDYTRPGTWSLVISFPKKMYVFDEFPGAMHLVERIRAHYPGVEMRGVWPMGSLEAPSRGGQVPP